MWWSQIIINLVESLSVWWLQIIINLVESLSVWRLQIITNLTKSLSVWWLHIIINLTESLSVWRLQIIIDLTEPLSVWWIKRCYRSSVIWLNHFYCEGSIDFTDQHQSDWIYQYDGSNAVADQHQSDLIIVSMMDQAMLQIIINMTELLSIWWINRFDRSSLVWITIVAKIKKIKK